MLETPSADAERAVAGPRSQRVRPAFARLLPWITPTSRYLVEMATALFALLALVLAVSGVGLQYDEGIFQLGAVQMLAGARGMEGDPQWVSVNGFGVKTMTFPYAGSVRELLLLGPFAVFGTDPVVGRTVAVALGALGVFGVGHLVRSRFGPVAGGVAALLLGLNPLVLDHVVFDNGLVAEWVGCTGLAALALTAVLRKPTPLHLAMLGAAAGLLVWTRLNAIWLLVALVVGLAVAARRPALHLARSQPRRLAGGVAALSAGGFLTTLPVTLYELRSHWATLDTSYVAQNELTGSLVQLRLETFARGLLGGPARPVIEVLPDTAQWQTQLSAIMIAALLLGALLVRRPPEARVWLRALSLSTAAYLAIMVTSSLNISGHHFVTVVPMVAALGGVLARVACRRRAGQAAATAAVSLYLAIAMSWNIANLGYVWDTRGVGLWSSAITCAARTLDGTAVPVQALDWGLSHGINVITRETPPVSDTFWTADERTSGTGLAWEEQAHTSGRYVVTARSAEQFPVARGAFLSALAGRAADAEVTGVGFLDGRGQPVLAIIDVSGSTPLRDADCQSDAVPLQDAQQVVRFLQGS